PLWLLCLVMALTPAICEELAFRGFILSGLRHLGHKWQAIAISSIFFAVTHQVFHQSIVACVMGLVLGYLAVQTGSLFTSMVFHFAHNSMLLAMQYLLDSDTGNRAWSPLVEKGQEMQYGFSWPVTLAGCLLAAGLLYCFHRLPYAPTSEEALQDALDHEHTYRDAAASASAEK
ncbi:MAG: CPBP family glutamic-type intramembrane protease, partial [Pirellulales bacterium]